MQIVKPDIREYKTNLREKYKSIRNNLSKDKKESLDKLIFERLTSHICYQNCNTLLTFVSTNIEVDTHRLINFAISQGKRVAVPKCIDGTRQMEFYLINSMDDLEVATFSVLEPKTDECEKLTDFENSICIVPGLAFDLKGYRLGYGKGYYDRFLSNYKGLNVGVCYCSCTLNKLLTGKFDKSVDLLITEKFTKKTN